MPGIMDKLFGAKPEVAPTPVPGAVPTPVPETVSMQNVVPSQVPAVSEGTAPNGVVPVANPAAPEAAPDKPLSPLDSYASLWDTPSSDPSNPQAPTLDPARLNELVAKADFSKTISPENMKAISEGGEAAVAAHIASMNAMTQQGMVQSTLIANKMVEDAVARMTAAQEARLPELVRQQATRNSLVESNPIFSNPAVKPIMEAAQAQLATQFPSATPSELAKMTQDFGEAMSQAFTKPAESTPSNPGTPGNTDWARYLEV